jgi:ABC-2 type transport system ATP-binding protein
MTKKVDKSATEPAIEVSGMSKNFALPHEKVNSMKGYFTRLFNMNRNIEVQHALRDISFEIKKGEFFGIVGRNGSGKSTLLKILAGIYQPTKGLVKVSGKLVPFIELGVGFNPELTGRENVYLNGALLGFSKKEMDEQYKEIVDFAELEDFMDQKLKNYSSGMEVRLAFSLAIRAKADVLLIDEVLAVGDADFQRKCFDYFRSLKNSDATVVFVTHDMSAVRNFCDRALLINNGMVTIEGDPERVSDEYLKLFNPVEKENIASKDVDNRWGNGRVTYGKASLKVDEDVVRLKLPIKNNTDQKVNNIRIGVDIHDSDKVLVTGTSSDLLTKQSISLAPKESKTIILEINNVFSGKSYSLHLTLRTVDGLTVYDDWREALSFSNHFVRNTYFPLMVNAKIDV